jgi:ribosome-binding factor A
MDQKHIRVSEQIAHAAAQFIARESSGQSLITVTRTDITDNFAKAIIYLSVLPESEEENALVFMKRSAGELRRFLKDNSRLQRIPHLEVQIDFGEKNRIHLDELQRKYESENGAKI